MSHCLTADLSSQPAVNIAAYSVTKCCRLAGDTIFILKGICHMLDHIFVNILHLSHFRKKCFVFALQFPFCLINDPNKYSIVRIVAD